MSLITPFEYGHLPNVRKMFIADNGFTNVDIDLDRADLQVVAWESGEGTIIKALQQKADLHLLNASDVYGLGLTFEDCLPANPKLRVLAAKYKPQRDKAKMFAHAVHYGAKGRRIALALGLTHLEGDALVQKYLDMRPMIRVWQNRVLNDLNTTRTIRNAFGYRRIFEGRADSLLPQALAWAPQSTVAIVIDRIMAAIIEKVKAVEVLAQVHDSLYFQAPSMGLDRHLLAVKEAAQIVIPYQIPLIIPCSFKISRESWGSCKDYHV